MRRITFFFLSGLEQDFKYNMTYHFDDWINQPINHMLDIIYFVDNHTIKTYTK